MSRGHGDIQRSIIRLIQAGPGPVLRNRVLWGIAEERANDGAPNHRAVMRLNRSFSRAVIRLEEERAVRITKRRLQTLADFVTDYPLRTTSPQIRKLREDFVPLLAERMADGATGEPSTRGEVYIIDRSIEQDPSWFEPVQRAWFEFERRLLRDAGDLSLQRRKALVELTAKGREYFEGRRPPPGGRQSRPVSPIELSTRSLLALIRALADVGCDTSDIEAWYGTVFPETDRQHVGLKEALYEVAFLGRGGKVSLRQDTKLWLLERAPEAVRALPAHKDVGAQSGVPSWTSRGLTEFSPLLDRIVDRHVFAKFEYLSGR